MHSSAVVSFFCRLIMILVLKRSFYVIRSLKHTHAHTLKTKFSENDSNKLTGREKQMKAEHETRELFLLVTVANH